MLRIIFISCIIFSVVYCQTSCSVNACTYSTATDRRKSASVDITFGSNLKYTPACVIIDKGTIVNFNGSFAIHPLEPGSYSKSLTSLKIYGFDLQNFFALQAQPAVNNLILIALFPAHLTVPLLLWPLLSTLKEFTRTTAMLTTQSA